MMTKPWCDLWFGVSESWNTFSASAIGKMLCWRQSPCQILWPIYRYSWTSLCSQRVSHDFQDTINHCILSVELWWVSKIKHIRSWNHKWVKVCEVLWGVKQLIGVLFNVIFTLKVALQQNNKPNVGKKKKKKTREEDILYEDLGFAVDSFLAKWESLIFCEFWRSAVIAGPSTES